MNKIAFYVLGGALALTGCNDTGFTLAPQGTLAQANPSGSTPAPDTKPPCPVSSSTKDVRIIFMMDGSGSTLTTDPDQMYQVQTIQKFNADYGAKTNLTYNFGYFSSSTANMFNMALSKFESPTSASPVGTSAQLSVALRTYDAIIAGGSTPYKAAFASMQATITADQNAGNKQDYAVVFMSDGRPTDVNAPFVSELNGLVTSLKTAAGANGSLLSLSAVYFGPDTDTTSIDNLKNMATTGGGQFVDTNKLGAGGLVINDVINVPGTCK